MNVRAFILSCGAIFGGAAMLGMPGLTGEAKAQQYACDGRPNEVFVVKWPGGNGVAPVDLCYEDFPETPSQTPQAPAPDPFASLASATEGFTVVMDAFMKLLSDPELLAFQNGGLWKYSQGYCGVGFLNPDGILAVYAPTRDFDGIVTVYQSDSIPKSAAPQNVTAEIEELDMSTGKLVRITVPAIHDDNSIFVIYQGKDYPIFLDSIKDSARYKMFLRKNQVFDVTMQNGFEAKRQLQKCRPS